MGYVNVSAMSKDIALAAIILEGDLERWGDAPYHLFAALCKKLGDLHGAPWLGVKGAWRRRGQFYQDRQVISLGLRVQGDTGPFESLLGERLEIGTMVVEVTGASTYTLVPAPVIYSPFVVIAPPDPYRIYAHGDHGDHSWWTSVADFRRCVELKLERMGVRASVETGSRLVNRRIAGHNVPGWPVTLRGLSPEHSLAVQIAGVGGRRRCGGGIFSHILPGGQS